MDRPGGRAKQPAYRKIKQRPGSREHHGKWPITSPARPPDETGAAEQPQVKILAKSNSKSSGVATPSAPAAAGTSVKPRPSVAALEKNIQATLNLAAGHAQSWPERVKLIDFEFNFAPEAAGIEPMLLPDGSTGASSGPASSQAGSQPPLGSQTFCVVAAVGLEGTGKSSVLNGIAQSNVFPTRRGPGRENPLSHVTSGVDLHVTAERVFLLDTQPLLSASVLDELIRASVDTTPATLGPVATGGSAGGAKHFFNSSLATPSFSSVVGFDIAETENFAFIYSLQMLTFLMTVCDHLVLVLDSLQLDPHLVKLLATAMMMVGDAVLSKANLILFLNRPGLDSTAAEKLEKAIRTALGPAVTVDLVDGDLQVLSRVVLRLPHSRSLLLGDQSAGGAATAAVNYQSERAWFHSIQRFWELSVRKSSLFADYARHLP